ncbi:MAG: tRNA (adenosine(37)-N6)-threonylcarbamoyltransferase complex ATPase subunit type 1 TsaE, partial [Cyanobacteria bacterium J06631_2]
FLNLEGLEIAELITSPTFTLINEYLDGRVPLYHLDLYRLEPNQVNSIYPEIYWLGEEVDPGITAIEWSQRLLVQPENYLKIKLTHAESSRKISLQSHGIALDLKFIQSFKLSTQ